MEEKFLRKYLTLLCLYTLCFQITSGRYRCNEQGFVRLGNSCYLFSTEITSWQEAHFRCRDHNSQLVVLATQHEDTTLRTYLEKPEFAQLGRWIGGMYVQGRWMWAATGTEVENPLAFANASVLQLPQTEQWMCLYMDSRQRYRWSNENCIHQLHYICESPLTKTPVNITEEPSITSSIASAEAVSEPV